MAFRIRLFSIVVFLLSSSEYAYMYQQHVCEAQERLLLSGDIWLGIIADTAYDREYFTQRVMAYWYAVNYANEHILRPATNLTLGFQAFPALTDCENMFLFQKATPVCRILNNTNCCHEEFKTQVFSIITLVDTKQTSSIVDQLRNTYCLPILDMFSSTVQEGNIPNYMIGALNLYPELLTGALCSTLRLLKRDKIAVVYNNNDINYSRVIFTLLNESSKDYGCPNVCLLRLDAVRSLENVCESPTTCAIVLLADYKQLEPLFTDSSKQNVSYFYVGIHSWAGRAEKVPTDQAYKKNAVFLLPKARRNKKFEEFLSSVTFEATDEFNLCQLSIMISEQNQCSFPRRPTWLGWCEDCKSRKKTTFSDCPMNATVREMDEIALQMVQTDIDLVLTIAEILKERYITLCLSANTTPGTSKICDAFQNFDADDLSKEIYDRFVQKIRDIDDIDNAQFGLFQLQDSTDKKSYRWRQIGECNVSRGVYIGETLNMNSTCTFDYSTYIDTLQNKSTGNVWKIRIGNISGACDFNEVYVIIWYNDSVIAKIILGFAVVVVFVSLISTAILLKHLRTPVVAHIFYKNWLCVTFVTVPLFCILALFVSAAAYSTASCVLLQFLWTFSQTISAMALYLAASLVRERSLLRRTKVSETLTTESVNRVNAAAISKFLIALATFAVYLAIFASSVVFATLLPAQRKMSAFSTRPSESGSTEYAKVCHWLVQDSQALVCVPELFFYALTLIETFRARKAQFVIEIQQVTRYSALAITVLAVNAFCMVTQYSTVDARATTLSSMTNMVMVALLFLSFLHLPVVFFIIAQKEKNTERFLRKRTSLRSQCVGRSVFIIHRAGSF